MLQRRHKTVAALTMAGLLWAGCNSLPPLPPTPAPSGRTGTNVGIASVFFADLAALAKAGKVAVLSKLLPIAIANGSASDLINTLEILKQDGKAAPYASALDTLLNADLQAPLGAALAANGPLHLMLSDPMAPQVMSVIAALDRTAILRQVGYQAMDTAIQSPLMAYMLPDMAAMLGQGGADATTYLASVLAVQQLDASGGQEPVGIAGMDLLLALYQEGNIHPLLDPFTSALSDPAVAEHLRILGALVDDLATQPADLAQFNAVVDSLGVIMGSGVLDAQLTSPDGVNPSPVRELVELLIVGNVPVDIAAPVPGAAPATYQFQMAAGTAQPVSINLLDTVGQLLGPGGTVGQQLIAALNATPDVNAPFTDVIAAFQPALTYPYHLGQPVTDGSMGGTVGLVQFTQLVHDGLYAYVDTSSLVNFLSGIPGFLGGPSTGYSILSSTLQCGTMVAPNLDPNNNPIWPEPVTAIPTYPFSVALQLFDDINSEPDAETATERATFLMCFFSRQGRLPSFLTNSTIASIITFIGGPDFGAGDPNGLNNPTTEWVLGHDYEGQAVFGALFDPDFNLAYSDETALGTHVRSGPLRLLYPFFNTLYNIANNDPVYPNLLRYFSAMAAGINVPSYIGPDGLSHPVAGDLLTPTLPLLQPLFSLPTPQTSPLSQLVSFFWNDLQNLPVDNSTLANTLVSTLAATIARSQDPTVPPLWEPLLNVMETHKEDLDRTTSALWPGGGPFVLDGVPGSMLTMADVMMSGSAAPVLPAAPAPFPGMSATFAGSTPRLTAPAELQALLGKPLDQMMQVLQQLRQVDPQNQLYWQGQRLMAEGGGVGLSASGSAALQVPGMLPLTHLMLQIDLLPQTLDTVMLVDQAGLTPGLVGMGDTFIQGGAALEALDVVQLTLQDAAQ